MEKLLYGSLSPLLRLLTFFRHTAVFFSVFTASPTFPAIHGRKSSSMRNSRHLLVFDYDNQLFLSNQSAKKLFPFYCRNRNGSLDIHDFISSLGLKEQVPESKKAGYPVLLDKSGFRPHILYLQPHGLKIQARQSRWHGCSFLPAISWRATRWPTFSPSSILSSTGRSISPPAIPSPWASSYVT